ncbi:MAG: ATP-binding protein [Burkholderiaceae bacterium]|nr:ATP-binding protein [Burkholderiaceae bacterium]
MSEDSAFDRLWHGFMTARVMIALVLLALLASLFGLGQAVNSGLMLICGVYLSAALAVRLFAKPLPPGQTFDAQWFSTIGVDIMAFSALQYLQVGGINYTPLFALPLLLAAVLGSLLLALGTAAGVALLLLGDAWAQTLAHGDSASRFLQAGMTGIGFFVVAFLANQLASRLSRQEQLARRSQEVARLQIQVNELVIESLDDGVAVVDANSVVRAANPAARRLLDSGGAPTRQAPFMLTADPAWQPLVELAALTFSRHGPETADVAIRHAQQGPRRIRVHTRLTATQDLQSGNLCVMFMQDLREMEARIRTEKLAAMGRMSSAVAHEIRNPLAAITQANALLDEDITDPGQKQLTLMVRQNARRLAQIVDEILNISRVQHAGPAVAATPVNLDEVAQSVCTDWALQNGNSGRLRVVAGAPGIEVAFEPEHLRRVLLNLLDNAARYAGQGTDSIRVSTHASPASGVCLRVWSDGEPLEHSVQRHLFEPFFSSESRSTGLGLYICRELCERHGAAIGYQRVRPAGAADQVEGNEFFVNLRQADRPGAVTGTFDTIPV